TQPRELTVNLDEMSLPARSLTKKYRAKYFRGTWCPITSVMTSRGCPYRCNFCSVWKHEHGKYRTRSPENVIKELGNIEEEYISISDDNFFHDFKRAEEIYEIIKERNIRKKYKLIGRSDTIVRHPDIVEKWKEIGMEIMIIGFESFRNEELQALNKHNSVYNNNEAIRILHENQVIVSGHFIINPDYTEQDFNALAEYVKEMKITQPVFCVLTPLPGTDLFEEKKGQLLTRNYEMFDLVHVVLPTRLSQKNFYKHYSELYRKCYLDGNDERSQDFLISKKIIDQIRLISI
ncbi:MAG TPA: B12-binding domain-containing radical SAM protein, partial [Elusimicrobia bacterium]|nr:B12-binding domain-containing radical SAM protein [Elusimicrobiota bacterium]